MHLRLDGSKVRTFSQKDSFIPRYAGHKGSIRNSGFLARWMATRSVGFVYILRSEHGLIKLGSCMDPLTSITQLRKAAPYRLHIDYLGFTRTDLAAEVENAAKGILQRHSTDARWFDCEPEVAVAAIQTAAKRLGYGMIQTNLEGVEDVLRNPSWVAMARIGLRRGRRVSWGGFRNALVKTSLALTIIGGLAFALTRMAPMLDLRILMGPLILVVMIFALFALRPGKTS